MSKLIMTANDSTSIRQMVSFTLKRSGYGVVEAVDGRDALNNLNVPLTLVVSTLVRKL